MAITAGAISLVSTGSLSVKLSATAATGGTAPYTYQWYRSTTTGFTPGAGNILTGLTGLNVEDTTIQPNTVYYYKVIATDAVAATITYAQLSVTTLFPGQSMNQFDQTNIVGKVDMQMSIGSFAVQIDATQATTLMQGQAVKLVANNNGGIPKVIGCSANSDEVLGFINYDIKSKGFVAGDKAEISMFGNFMWLYATGAVTQGAQVQLDVSSPSSIAQAVTSSGAKIVGWAFDGAAAGGTLIRVAIQTPSFKVA